MPNSSPESTDDGHREDKQRRRLDIEKKIQLLQVKSLKGLIVLIFFILISIGAINEFRFLPSLPDGVRTYLGEAPSADLISIALLLYLVSALILTFMRIMTASGAHGGFAHLGYLVSFYAFYHFSGSLTDHFWAVFVTGITVIGLESYHIYLYCSEVIKEEEEDLNSLRNG
ncbi:MAG: hypothetical protein U1C55_06750 [Smithellaceae bacterium]|nr:hypothetical protein [Smithellaceae bacterium]